MLFLCSASPRQVFIEWFLWGNIISQWFLTFLESQHSLKIPKAPLLRKCCWEINRKQKSSGHDRAPEEPILKHLLEAHNVRHYDAIDFEIKPKVTWPGMIQMCKQQAPIHPLISVNGSTIHPAAQDGTQGSPWTRPLLQPPPYPVFHYIGSSFQVQALTSTSSGPAAIMQAGVTCYSRLVDSETQQEPLMGPLHKK